MSFYRWLTIYSLTAFGLIFSAPYDTVSAQLPVGKAPHIDTNRIDTNRIEVLVPAVDGMIRWKDVATSVGDALKLDPEPIQKILPSGQLDLRSDAVLLVLMGINLAAGDAISFDIVRDPQNRRALSVKCNRDLFGLVKEKQPAAASTAGIEIDEDWEARSTHLPVVVCLHGLQSRPSVFGAFREFLRGHGYATAAVSYDHEHSIERSAEQLAMIADRLFASSNPTPQLALVGHSMGGLVAREWTENPSLSDPRIVALITIGTPHGGSNWASLPPLLNLFTAGQFDANDLVDVILHQPSASGLRDLIPGSEFLTRMAARPRSPNVAYTTIVGTGSPIEEAQVSQLRSALLRLDRNGGAVRLLRPRIRPLLESFDELARGKGDGVVAVERATIAGSADVVAVDVSHFEMVRPTSSRDEHPVWPVVLERLDRLKAK